MIGPAISEWAVSMVVEGTGGTVGTGVMVVGAGGADAGAGGLEPEAPQCALL